MVDISSSLKQDQMISSTCSTTPGAKNGTDPEDVITFDRTSAWILELLALNEEDPSNNSLEDDNYQKMQNELINNIKAIARKSQVTKNKLLSLLGLNEEEPIPQQMTETTEEHVVLPSTSGTAKNTTYPEDVITFNSTLAWILELLALKEEHRPANSDPVDVNYRKMQNELVNNIKAISRKSEVTKRRILQLLALDEDDEPAPQKIGAYEETMIPGISRTTTGSF